ncbi:hypothetical protein AHAS_Ahas09G0074000 [Arachis hypogaea]
MTTVSLRTTASPWGPSWVLSGPRSSRGALGPPGQARFWSNLEFHSGCSSVGDGCAIGGGVGVSIATSFFVRSPSASAAATSHGRSFGSEAEKLPSWTSEFAGF